MDGILVAHIGFGGNVKLQAEFSEDDYAPLATFNDEKAFCAIVGVKSLVAFNEESRLYSDTEKQLAARF